MHIINKSVLQIITVLLCFFVSSGSAIVAQSQNINVLFESFPDGAFLTVDGNSVGITPITLNIRVGSHTIQATFDGFQNYMGTTLVDSTTTFVSIKLNPGPNLTLLPIVGDKVGVDWASAEDKVRISSGGYAANPFHYTTFDLNKHITLENISSLDTLSGIQIKEALANSPIFQSPSGHYLVYIDRSTLSLAVRDTGTNVTTTTNIQFPMENGKPLVQIIWSQNETAIWLKRQDSFAQFLFIENGQIKLMSLVKFKSNSNEDVYAEYVYARPSEQKKALVLGRIADHSAASIWLVNLSTMVGVPIQINSLLDIAFSSDGKSIYVITKDGFGRVNPDLKTVSYIPSLLSNSWGVYAASLSPTLHYAFLTVGSTESQSYWIYKLPALP